MSHDSDFEYAKRLHEELNIDTSMDDSVVFVCEEAPSTFSLKSQPKVGNVDLISFASPANNVNDLGKKFYCKYLNKYLLEDGVQEWVETSIDKCAQFMFDRVKQSFFDVWLKGEQYTVSFDVNSVICDDSSFKIFSNERSILLAKQNIIRPRIDVMSLMLHILIHLYLHKESKGAIKLSHHDANFRKIMQYINGAIGTSISASHTFVYSPQEDEYHKHWWQCTGNCAHYQPFFGVIRSTIVPDESQLFWKTHDAKCTGTFFRILEFQKNNENGDVEKKYLRSMYYMNPQAMAAPTTAQTHHPKTNLPVRALIDLTEEASSPVVKNCYEVIDLDESQFAKGYESDTSQEKCEYFDSYKLMNTFSISFPCCFCFEEITTSQLARHFDACSGCQKKVDYKPRR